MNLYEWIGRMVVAHYLQRVRESSLVQVASNLKKQGWKLALVLAVLVGKEPRS